MNIADIGPLLAVVGCFLGAAALSAAEVSLLRVRRSRLVVLADEGDARTRRLLALVDDLPIVLHSVLLVALLLQVSTATASGFLAQRWFGDVGVSAATVATTIVLFLYAEAIPKTMAIRSPYPMARRVTPYIAALVAIVGPMVRFLVWLADKQIPGSNAITTNPFDEAEFLALAKESADAGLIAEDDATLLERSFQFNDRRVVEVMVDRDDITFARAETSLSEARAQAVSVGHRRLPVCGTDVDDIIGVARFRDIVAAATDNPDAPLTSVVSEVLRCAPDLLISELVRRMQARGRWLAIVTDPPGRTLGLVTIEDLVAELVGEISEDGVSTTQTRRPPTSDGGG